MPHVVPAPDARPASPLRFGPAGRFELQAAERRLLVDGRPAPLGARALDLLITLAAQPDHLLTKNELLDRVWPGLVVEEANLQMQISNLRKLLGGDVIATVPGRGYRFVATVAAAAAAAALPAATPAAPGAPPAHRLFGRDDDLVRLEALLREGGCVTLVGTSGVGKTSLARAATARWAGRSVWVDLAPLAQDGEVAAAIARASGAQLGDGETAPQLLRALQGGGAMLLVLDNAEHLIQACAEVVSLLGTLPAVHLLVTSQLPLSVTGERVQRLEPLALSAPDSGATAGLGDGALALLVERIVAADHRFRVTPAALPLLQAICTHLDGLPLALEMAAARVPALGLQGVHDALAHRFALLTRGRRDAAERHRTLRNALDWSYRLLGASEQRLFRAFGVFAGGFTLDLALALAADDPDARWDVIDGLATLADRSLVAVSADDPPRYRLLETLRAFALEQLVQEGEEATLRRRHAGALVALFARYKPGDDTSALPCLAEMENAREAIAWAQVHDLALAAQLAARVTRPATFSSWRHEAGNWLRALEPAMLQPAGQALPAQVQAAWWTEFARALGMRRQPRAAAAARRAYALWQPLQQPRQSLFAAVVWVRAIVEPGAELDEACAALRVQAAALTDPTPHERLLIHGALVKAALDREDHEAVLAGRLAEVELAREQGWQAAAEAAETNVINSLNTLGRHAEAAARGRELLARIDGAGRGDNGNLPWALSGLLDALIALRELDEARVLVARACAAGQRFDTPVSAPLLAALALAQGRCAAAARLVGYARHSFAARGMKLEDGEERLLAHAQEAAAAALGAGQAEALVQQGRSLSDEAAAALAAQTPP